MRKAIATKYPEICPKFINVESLSELALADLSEFQYPLIVKPNGLHSSYLVNKCHNQTELENVIKKIFKGINTVYKREYGTGKPGVTVEEFMSGDMYSVDVYVDNDSNCYYLPLVRVVTSAEKGLDGYHSYSVMTPTDLGKKDVQDANLCATKGIDALGLKNSTAHVEMFKTKSGWKIIEIGPRIGGHRQSLYWEAFGIDHYYNDLLIHMGEKPDLRHTKQKYALSFNMYADSEGEIVSIKGLDEARLLEGVVYIKCYVAPGDKAIHASNGGQFLIDGVVAAHSRDHVEDALIKIREKIKVEVRSGSASHRHY